MLGTAQRTSYSSVGFAQKLKSEMDRVTKDSRLVVNEIFFSIQGEGTRTGMPCVFVRLTGCNLRCSYCDTAYAFHEGHSMSLEEILDRVRSYGCRLVEITGGEPLLQAAVRELMDRLVEEGTQVLLETSGERDIGNINPRVVTIMDVKCPSSGESGRNRRENLALLRRHDELKFVIGNREDYEWATDLVRREKLSEHLTVLFSPVHGQLPAEELAEWILEDRLPVRFQVQLHKVLWGANARGR